MDFNTVNNIKSKDEFLDFMRKNIISHDNCSQLNDYLASIVSWVEDMDGFYINTKQDQPDINWGFVSTLFYVGKIYE